jgi:hypothetical protein
VADDAEVRAASVDGQIAAALSELLASPAGQIGLAEPGDPRTVRKVLCDPDSPPEQLELAKGIGRRMVAAADCDVDQAVGTALWYAAMAASICHDQPVRSRMSARQLRRGLAELRDKLWLPEVLGRLVDQTLERIGPIGTYQSETPLS